MTHEPQTTPAEVESPICRGGGGFNSWGDGWSEYDECSTCNETGRVTSERKAAIVAENARIDAWCDEQIRLQEATRALHG